MTTYDFVLERERKKGIEEGLEKGMEKGMEKGKESVLRRLVISCKKKGLENEKIADLLEISEADVLDFLSEN